MIEWPNVIDKLILLAGNVAILLTGVRVMAMSWEAPHRGSLPLIMTEEDRDQRNGHLRVRQLLLFFTGFGLICCAVYRLPH